MLFIVPWLTFFKVSTGPRRGMPGELSSRCNHIAFNQDTTCISVANNQGIFVYSLECEKVVYSKWLGSIKLCQMLFSTSLLAYVGSGEQVKLTPRKVSLLNTTTEALIQELSFPTSVIAVHMNRQRLVAVLEQKVLVYALDTLEMISTLDTLPNLRGICAITTGTDPCYLAVLSQSDVGSIRICNATEGNHILAELSAHKSKLAALAWNSSGTLLASASDKGTVLRVHGMPQATKAYSFRRGTTQAGINCLAFSAEGVSPQLLACASSHGTIHLWNLDRPGGLVSRSSSGLLASVMPSSMTDYVDPQRCIVNLRLPAGVPTICAIQAKKVSAATSQMMEKAAAASTEGVTVLSVVTEDAILYTYHIPGFKSGHTPTLALHDERYLLSKGYESLLHAT